MIVENYQYYGINLFLFLFKGNLYYLSTYRYKSDITPEQKDSLMDLIKFKNHEEISTEIRRELVSATPRGEILSEPMDFSF